MPKFFLFALLLTLLMAPSLCHNGSSNTTVATFDSTLIMSKIKSEFISHVSESDYDFDRDDDDFGFGYDDELDLSDVSPLTFIMFIFGGVVGSALMVGLEQHFLS